jgi:hypothetical protein
MTDLFYLIRPASYSYLLDGKDLYDSFDAVATNTIDVGITPEAKPCNPPLTSPVGGTSILCANDRRSFQTASLLTKYPLKLDLLHEIRYEMSQVMSKTAFFGTGDKPDIIKARRSFAEALAKNRLTEKYPDVVNRAINLLNHVRDLDGEAAVLVSHGFFIKFVEIYLRRNAISHDAGLFLKYFNEDSSMFGFCEGFSARLNEGKFMFDRYLRSGCDDHNDK